MKSTLYCAVVVREEKSLPQGYIQVTAEDNSAQWTTTSQEATAKHRRILSLTFQRAEKYLWFCSQELSSATKSAIQNLM